MGGIGPFNGSSERINYGENISTSILDNLQAFEMAIPAKFDPIIRTNTSYHVKNFSRIQQRFSHNLTFTLIGHLCLVMSNVFATVE